jgi:ferritin-like metal-binding protein YciE
MDTLQKLFEDTVKDLYNAEHNFLKAMPKLMKSAESESLKQAIEAHIEQSKVHVERLDELAKQMGFKPGGMACKASQGLVAEAQEHLEEYETGPVLDAAIIACAQKNEHYEICSYRTLITWAHELGLSDASALLKKTLEEEEQTDALLGKVLASSVIKQAKAVETGGHKSKVSVK